jgi:predicted nucleotidyltransferase
VSPGPEDLLDFAPAPADIPDMTREDVVARLRALKPRINADGIEHLYRFGSVLYDEESPESDVDLFFDHNLPQFGLLDYVHLKDIANELMGQKVDLVERSCLQPKIRARVEAEALRVF